MAPPPQAIAIIGLDFEFLQVNPALGALLDRDEQWLLAHTLRDVIYPEDLATELASRSKLPNGAHQSEFRECRWLKADGSSIWVADSMGLLRNGQQEPLFYVFHAHDNTAAHDRSADLAFRAGHDALTGLTNRDQLQQRISGFLARDPGRPGVTGLLYCDLDDFAEINNTYGHAAGDRLLQVAAQRMAQAVRAGDVVARIGGDEFVVVLGEVHDLPVAVAVAEKIRAALREPVLIEEEHRITIRISVGVALASQGISAHRLLRNADSALYAAKNSRRDRIAVFDGGGRVVVPKAVRVFRQRVLLVRHIDTGCTRWRNYALWAVIWGQSALVWHQT